MFSKTDYCSVFFNHLDINAAVVSVIYIFQVVELMVKWGTVDESVLKLPYVGTYFYEGVGISCLSDGIRL